MATRVERRRLKFTSLTEVMPDLQRLLTGHVTAGQWSLGVICYHLRLAIELSMDGFPAYAPWLFRRTLGPVGKGMVLGLGRIPRGVPAPGWRVPAEPMDPKREAARLGETIGRFMAFS